MARLDRNRLIAIFRLAVTFWAHILGKLWARLRGRPRRGLETFASNYRPDGIWLVGPEDRAALPELGECISCRLCDPVCPSMHAANGRGFVGPSRLVMANSRLLPAVATWIDPFLCIRCRACDDACPQGVRIDRLAGTMRGAVAREAAEAVPAELARAVERVRARGHLFAEAPPPAPRRAEDGPADYLYLASCAARAGDVEAETALLERAGVDYASAPPLCCGGFEAAALGGGEASRLHDALSAAKALHVATGDPRCLEHLRASPRYRDLQVLHVLELAAEVRAPAPPAPGERPPRVTYHDPCHLARSPGGIAYPRDAIRRAGAEIVEMRRHGRGAPCCGMCGGTWTFEPALAEELGRARVREAAETGAPVILTQSCLCRDHLASCAEKEGLGVEVRNVTEFLAERSGALAAVRAAMEPSAAPSAAPGTAPGASDQRGSMPAGVAPAPEPGPTLSVPHGSISNTTLTAQAPPETGEARP